MIDDLFTFALMALVVITVAIALLALVGAYLPIWLLRRRKVRRR